MHFMTGKTLMTPELRRARSRRGAFTLVEIMVALGILSVMLVIVFVPLNLGFNMFHIGKARSEVQSAAQSSLDQMEKEIRLASYIFPNDRQQGVTDRAPYLKNLDPDSGSSPIGFPYFYLTNATQTISDVQSGTTGVCGGIKPFANTTRIDFLLPRRDPVTGVVIQSPFAPKERYLVSYYPRRLDPNKTYNPRSNPIVLWRAQAPYQYGDGSDFNVATSTPNVDLSTLYPASCTTGASASNRGSLWLTHTRQGEANLEPLCVDATQSTLPIAQRTVVGSHVLLTPRGMALFAPEANSSGIPNYTPTNTFLLDYSDTPNSSGERPLKGVRITLDLMQFDAIGADTRNRVPRGQRVSFTREIRFDQS